MYCFLSEVLQNRHCNGFFFSLSLFFFAHPRVCHPVGWGQSPVMRMGQHPGGGRGSWSLGWGGGREEGKQGGLRGRWRWWWFCRARSCLGTSCSSPPSAGCRRSAGTDSPDIQSGTACPSIGTRSWTSRSREGSGSSWSTERSETHTQSAPDLFLCS